VPEIQSGEIGARLGKKRCIGGDQVGADQRTQGLRDIAALPFGILCRALADKGYQRLDLSL
jgi:hypothetical protein